VPLAQSDERVRHSDMRIVDIKKGAHCAPIPYTRPEGFEPPTLGSEVSFANLSSNIPLARVTPSDHTSCIIPRFFFRGYQRKTFFMCVYRLLFYFSYFGCLDWLYKPVYRQSVCVYDVSTLSYVGCFWINVRTFLDFSISYFATFRIFAISMSL
jgi:hypothetical protein